MRADVVILLPPDIDDPLGVVCGREPLGVYHLAPDVGHSKVDRQRELLVRCMANDQAALIVILLATVAMFIWGRLRHDMVALGMLLTCTAAGLVPVANTFNGFSHPAVITVACVLVLSSALQSTGAVDAVTHFLVPRSAGPTVTITALAGLAALLSGFINNVGALAVLLPVAIQVASRLGFPPGKVLMPLAFGSILGGLTTLIGTPPNLIVSGFRAEVSGMAFAMFDFTPVGIAVALAGLAFIAIGGLRLVPTRDGGSALRFATGAYLSEARVPEGSRAAGMTLREVELELDEADAKVVGLVRGEVRMLPPHPMRNLCPGDILLIKAEPDALASLLSNLDLRLTEDVPLDQHSSATRQGSEVVDNIARTWPLQAGDNVLMELVVRPRAGIVAQAASGLGLRSRYGINLLAISRQGHRPTARLRATLIREGDVLLVQGPSEAILEFANQFGCVPLAERPLLIPDASKALVVSGVMAVAVGVTALGLTSATVAFASAVLAVVVIGAIPGRRIYDAIDWPVIVLLASLIPVAGAMETTGTADLVAKAVISQLAQGQAAIALLLILISTMTLSDIMNNAATAAVMCPIAIRTSEQLGSNPDPFLMAVAVGASCAFLTPIGHQNNTLIMGPSGFRFGDYWRLGLPLEIVIAAVAVPMILIVWPI